MQPFLPPEHTTSALKGAVRHSRHLISVSPSWHSIERERERGESEMGMMSLHLSDSLSLYLHLSFSLCRTSSFCHTSSLSLSLFLIAWGGSYSWLFFLFLSRWFTVCVALPLCISVCLCPPLLAATLLLTWHKEVVSPERKKEQKQTEVGWAPKCDWSYLVSDN